MAAEEDLKRPLLSGTDHPPSASAPAIATTNVSKVDAAGVFEHAGAQKLSLVNWAETVSGTRNTRTQSNHAEKLTLHEAAQRGSFQSVKYLLDSKKASPNDVDPTGVTALHYAALQNHDVVAKFLIDKGAQVDAFGGELRATPLHWAASPACPDRPTTRAILITFCTHTSHIMFQPTFSLFSLRSHQKRPPFCQGANPTLRDGQGFNALHLSVHSSNAMLVLYFLYLGMDIDVADSVGAHTPLMWAAYQGDSLTVDLLLRHGASVECVDANRLTALHWAVVKGNRGCIKKILEYHGDTNTKEENGKTPGDFAREKGLTARTTNTIIYLIPFVVLYIVLRTLAFFPIYTGLPLALLEFLAAHLSIVRFLIRAPSPDAMLRTPYFSSIFQSSAFWVLVSWGSTVVYATSYMFLTNLLFLTTYVTAMYCFYRAVLADPGFVAKLSSREDQKRIVLELADEVKLDARHFCFTCV
ncbi:ankyrin repeat-containing domain protein, partial [Jimgerdemannia flammicorona]